jgi:AGZA family xanthine/uracil permease-like MFS transporter
VLVGYLMFTLIRDIPVDNVEDGLPALLTMVLMPLTFNITVGIGAGFISWVVIKVVRGKWSDVPLLMWIVAAAFIVYFLTSWITTMVSPPPAG